MTSGERELSPPAFAVSQFTTWHLGFEEDLRLLHGLGIRHIELCERKLSDDPGRARDQFELVGELGFEVTSIQPSVHALYPDGMCPDIADPRERVERFKRSIDRFCEHLPGRPLTFVTITGAAPGNDFRQAHRTARELYPALADHARQHGARIALEPLSPILMNIDTFVCTLDDATRLIDDVERANVGLLFDVWHLWREPGLRERIAHLGGRIHGVHVSDWPYGEPRRIADRAIPGQGLIDLPGIFGALEGVYDGAYCLELFSADELEDSLWGRPPGEVIVASHDGFRRAWAARQ